MTFQRASNNGVQWPFGLHHSKLAIDEINLTAKQAIPTQPIKQNYAVLFANPLYMPKLGGVEPKPRPA